MLNCFN